MDRVYQANAIETPPSSTASSGSYPTAGDKASGRLATVPGPYWFYSITEEIRNALIAAGVTPDAAKVNQLAEAMSKFLPLSGGNVTGNLTVQSKNVVRSVNGTTADASGNVAISVPPTPNAYVTATWKSGTSWYRKWSDGWIEQGGKVSSSSQSTTISFHTSFSSAPCVNATAIGELNNFNDNPCVNSVSTTKFVAYVQSAASPYLQGWYWYACGK